MKMFVLIFLSTLSTISAFAKPAYMNMLNSTYAGTIIPSKCNVCHRGGSPMNPFGRDFAQLKSKYGMGSMQAVFADLKLLDSDQDGLTNDQEILAGSHPGVANTGFTPETLAPY